MYIPDCNSALFKRNIYWNFPLSVFKSSHLPKKKRTIIVWWCHFTATTRILQFVVSLWKSGLYLFVCLFVFFFTNVNKKAKTKWILAVVVKYCHCENGPSSISWRVFSFFHMIDNYHFHDHGIFYRTQPTFAIFGNFAADRSWP